MDGVGLHRAGDDGGNVHQVTSLQLEHGVERVSLNSALHDLATHLGVKVSGQIITNRRGDDNQRSDDDQHQRKQADRGEESQLRDVET